MSAAQNISLHINGEDHDVRILVQQTLLEVLRDQLYLTGTKLGCNQGVCGACTVLRDGVPTRACLTLAIDSTEFTITTIEGIVAAGEVLPIQQAFIDTAAPQCGFCMSGRVLVAKSLLETNPRPTRAEIREALSGNLCRCTGYTKIVEAIELISGNTA
jgi:aerobic-type carbon monoxide dehydrogenase small subunit (CoxS/CutS family)